MQFSKTWLQSFFTKSLDQYDLSHILTMAGLEVDDIQDLGKLSSNIVVSEIIKVDKHTDADRLNICQVDVGQESPLQIVCGAPNAREGIKVPCALVGAKLPNFDIKKAKLRGIDSFGMLCSAKEIGLSDQADGLYELPQNITAGKSIKEALLLNDTIFTLSLTPNRADCLSMIGIAREISAKLGLKIKDVEIKKPVDTFKNNQNVLIKDKNACPRYCGVQLKNINNKVNLPSWMIAYLDKAGISSINPVVDITNFVLLEQGQPLHAFDQDKLNGNITVQRAKKSESLLLLDEQKIEFRGNELLITDNSGPLALAGIMGGLSSSINSNTEEIFLESAFFAPDEVAGRARSFGLNTESSHRFERGVDFQNTLTAIYRAVNLIQEYCGGECSNIIDYQSKLPERNKITLRTKKINDILGIKIQPKEVEEVLKSLNLNYTKNRENFTVIPQSFRFDLNIEADLIEEFIRMYGYENIPSLIPESKSNIVKTTLSEKSLNDIKLNFTNLGYNEVITYSFIAKDIEEKFHQNKNTIELDNPIASQMNVMRSKLWSSHIETLIYNINRGQTEVRIFEIASTYNKRKDDIFEESIVSGLVYGSELPEQWSVPKNDINFYNIKGDIEIISSNLLEIIEPKSNIPASLHPGQTAEIIREGNHAGWVGQLHPSWNQKYDLDKKVYLFEFKLNLLINNPISQVELPSKQIPVRRDLSIVIDKQINVGDIVSAIKSKPINRLVEFYPFDIYEGKGIENNKKSIAFLILMQDTYKTLEENEVNDIVDQVLNVLKTKFDATLR